MHKETCSEYLQLRDLANTSTPPGKKKRDCPILEIEDDSDQDSDNSSRRRKLTKRVSVGIESAKTPRPLGARELNRTPPYLYVPGIGRESPPRTIFDGCFCCGNNACKYTNFTISDLSTDCDDKLAEHDPRDPLDVHPTLRGYQPTTRDDLTLEGTIVREAVLCLLASEDVFSYHKYVGSRPFDDKLLSYFTKRLPYRADLVSMYYVPLRLATKMTLQFLRLECIECIREKFIGESPSQLLLAACLPYLQRFS